MQSGGEGMNVDNLMTLLTTAYLVCSLVLAYPIGRMAYSKNKGYKFRVYWYHKAASGYVFAFFLSVLFFGLVIL